MRKSRLAALLVVLIPMLFSIGFSAWIIVHEFVIQPVYQEYIDDYFGTSQTKTYTGGILLPDQIFPIDGDRFPESDLSYQFKLSSSSTWTNVVKDSTGPIDVGTYDIKVTVASLGETYDVTLIITPKKVSIDTTNNNNIISLNYDSAKRTFDSMKSDIALGVKFLDETGNSIEIPSDQYDISGIQNGTFYYGSLPSRISTTNLSDTENSKVAGSIYEAYVTFTKGNYEFISSINDFVIFKYCTVKDKDIDSGSFTTLEDGIKGTLNMILLGDSTNDSKNIPNYVISCFSKITYVVNNYGSLNYNLRGNKIVVPYDSSGTDKISADPGGTSPVYSVLYIPESIILNVSNGSSVTVGAKIGFTNTPYQAAVGAHGVVMNHGTINVNSGCTYNSYGFTKGIGKINLYSGSTATDVFTTYDWPGGSAAMSLVSSVFPLTKWSVYNISCKTYIFANATYNAFTTIYSSKIIVGYNDFTVTIIGNTSTSECMFRPSSSTNTSDYVLKYTEVQNDSITKSNQIYGTITTVEVNGDYQDGNITIKYLGNMGVSTSTSKATPISNLKIILNSGSNLNISKASYIFMNSSVVYVNNRAVLNIGNSSAYFAFLDGTKLVLNGTLSGSGKIGGLIESTEIGAISTISTYSVSYKVMSNSASVSGTADAKGMFWDNGVVEKNFKDFGTGVFTTNNNNSENAVVFEFGTKYYTYTINYYDKNGDAWELCATDSQNSLESSLVIDKSYTSELIKPFYEFDKWYTDQSLTNEFNGTTLVGIENGISNLNLYANWNIKEYTFTYNFYYNDNSLSEDQVTIINKLEKFTINNFVDDILTISTQVSYLGKTFVGWYVGIKDVESGMINSSLSKEDFSKLLGNVGDATEIPLYCEFIDSKTVTFIHNCDGVTIDDAMVMVGETFIIDDYLKDFSNQLAIMNEKNSNILVSQYFKNNWYYLDSNSDRVYVTELEITDNVVLYAEWENKVQITMNYDFAYVNQPGVCKRRLYYYKPGQSFDINVLKSQIKSDIPTGFEFSGSTIYTNDGFSVAFSDTTINASATYYARLKIKVTWTWTNKGTKPNSTIMLDDVSQGSTDSSNQTITFDIESTNSKITITMSRYVIFQSQTTYNIMFLGKTLEIKNSTNAGDKTVTYSINAKSTTLDGIIS